MPRLLCLLVLAGTPLRAQAQWSTAVTSYRADDQPLRPQRNELGFLRVPRIGIEMGLGLPRVDSESERVPASFGGGLSLEVPIGVGFTAAVYGCGRVWWTDTAVEDARRSIDAGARLRARFSFFVHTLFVGAHGGYSADFDTDSQRELHGAHVGAHAGVRSGKHVSTEISFGVHYRMIGNLSHLEPFFAVGINFPLWRVR